MNPLAELTERTEETRPAEAAAPWLWSVAVGLAALVLYVLLAPPVMGEGDAGEFTLVLATAGVPHPTGYPLYTILGHFFVSTLHAFGLTWAFVANLWSALGAAVAVSLYSALLARLAPPGTLGRVGSVLLALLAAALLGLNPVWLANATQAEVYSWHAAWVAGVCLLALRLIRGIQRVRVIAAKPLAEGAVAWGVVAGIGLAHHLTSVFLLVPLTLSLFAVLYRSKNWRSWLVLAASAGAAVPLASYGFLVYRAYNPAAFQWPLLEPSIESALRVIRASDYAVLLGGFRPTAEQSRLLLGFIYPYLVPGLLLLGALAVRLRAHPVRALLLPVLAAALLQIVFVLNYGVIDPAAYFLTPLMLVLLAIPLAGAWLLDRLPRSAGAMGVAALILVMAFFWIPTAKETRDRCIKVELILRERWNSIPFETGFVLWLNDFYTHLKAYQLLEGNRPGIHVENPNMLTWRAYREKFEQKYGFDPLAGMELRQQADVQWIPMNIKRQTDLPVVDFQNFRPWPRL